MTDIPPSVLDALDPSFMAGLLSGHLSGIDRGREQADTEAEALHRRAYAIVQAHASLEAHDLHAAAVRARQVASRERQKREADPWSYEGPPLPLSPNGYVVDPP